ncbi:carbon storage regulator CsrA [Robertmurraya korlensis]|uniref:carbon storage regulator CsrA n=1 Tax=Robertmurraya korlensis TaxID=519977 RepID=UPI00082584BE|nr:carbon storage regulator CsrA [Robertmurraya korlensis]
MLVLTRKMGESIKIGEDIEITILSVKNDHVKIGISAPKNIEITRKELLEQIREENVKAASTKVDLLHLLNRN